MAYTNDLTVQIFLFDVCFSSKSPIKVSQFPTNFEVEEFVSKINKIWTNFSDISFVDVNKPIVTLNNDEICFDFSFCEDWENNDDILAFILGGEKLPDSNVEWYLNTQKEKNDYERITILANQLLKLLENYNGEGGQADFGKISFFWEVSGDEGSDSYSVYLKFNAENEKFPIARIAADFYEEGEGW
ncbi:hypothetical protein N9546_04205 [Flavobacteriaceae bacterium]|nr:hypothetical protein [Flavobacteriaceae bacterium]MDB4144934.1 hypothetical protein [Flavobacteriaceae bacterium]|tara:strand:- start:30 stop:590 length:561 start_codon:yes stop_codon:yes gene_type:complete